MKIEERVKEIGEIRNGGNKIVLGDSLDAIPCSIWKWYGGNNG